MGREIERILVERGHSVELVIDEANASELTAENIAKVDVAFEFTTPETGADNVAKVLMSGGRVVCGTTGWLSRFQEMEELATTKGGALFYASNFSIGVNMMFRLNRRLAELMNPYPQYEVRIAETHHIWKKDAPSGTAITLAEGILENLDRKVRWVPGTLLAADGTLSGTTECAADELPVSSIREGEVPGIHSIRYDSEADSITITHDAKSRRGFALGAVLAAEYTAEHQGLLGMNDLFNF